MYYLQRAIWFECRQTYRQEDIEQTNEQRRFKLRLCKLIVFPRPISQFSQLQSSKCST